MFTARPLASGRLLSRRRPVVLAAATAALAVGVAGALSASADRGADQRPSPSSPPAVDVATTPEALEVGNALCGVGLLELAFTNDTDEALYTDVFIDAEQSLQVSKSAASSYLPPGFTQSTTLQIRPEPGAEPGVYDVVLDGGREPVVVPVTLADLSDAANIALRAEPSASSTFDNYPLCGAIDGDRNQDHWNMFTGWQDLTADEFPDWYQLTFDKPEQVGLVEVLTRPGNQAMRDWDVQVLVDGEWATVDEVRGNEDEVVRSTFDPVSTEAVRLWTLGSNDGERSRIVELEVYASADTGPD